MNTPLPHTWLVRWDVQSGSTSSVFPLDPALLSQEFGFQALVPSPFVFSSAVRLGIGGGL